MRGNEKYYNHHHYRHHDHHPDFEGYMASLSSSNPSRTMKQVSKSSPNSYDEAADAHPRPHPDRDNGNRKSEDELTYYYSDEDDSHHDDGSSRAFSPSQPNHGDQSRESIHFDDKMVEEGFDFDIDLNKDDRGRRQSISRQVPEWNENDEKESQVKKSNCEQEEQAGAGGDGFDFVQGESDVCPAPPYL
jgi:hypothetical protein